MAPWRTDFSICNFYDNFSILEFFNENLLKKHFSVHPLCFSVREWLFDGGVVTTPQSLVSDDVAIECNRPIKSRHQVKYETVYHTFSSCRRPSQPIGWFQIRHTHFDYFSFTWCADFTIYFYIFGRENRSNQEKLNHENSFTGSHMNHIIWAMKITF